jgi:hypothetical protein
MGADAMGSILSATTIFVVKPAYRPRGVKNYFKALTQSKLFLFFNHYIETAPLVKYMVTIGVIGTGSMGSMLIRKIIETGINPGSISVSNRSPDKVKAIAEKTGVHANSKSHPRHYFRSIQRDIARRHWFQGHEGRQGSDYFYFQQDQPDHRDRGKKFRYTGPANKLCTGIHCHDHAGNCAFGRQKGPYRRSWPTSDLMVNRSLEIRYITGTS